MKTLASLIAFVAILVGSSHGVVAQMPKHVLQMPQESQWGPAPPALPPGAQITVLSGDPTKAVAYTARLKFPENYAIPAHSHPTDENILVTSGGLRRQTRR